MKKRKMRSKYGTVINVVAHIITKNGWEYYVTDNFDSKTPSVVECLVMGFETELGDVWLPEIAPYKISYTTDLVDVAPATGWSWVD